MADSKFGLGKIELGKGKAKKDAKTSEPSTKKMIAYRVYEQDHKALRQYSLDNDISVQKMLNMAVRLLAVEYDIDLSDDIMKP